MMRRFFQSDFFYAFTRSPLAMVSLLVVALMVLSAVFANFIALATNPFDPASLNLMNGFTPPMEANMFTGEKFLLGTDDQGRDLFSAILYGLRVSLFVGMMAVGLAMVLGVLLGLIAGYVGGWLDTLIMRLADIQMTFPSILIAMLIFGVARGLLPPELREEMAIYRPDPVHRPLRVGQLCPDSARVDHGREGKGIRRRRALDRAQPLADHAAPHPAQRAWAGAGHRHHHAGAGDYRGGDAVLPRGGRTADRAELGTLIRIGQDFLFSGEWWILLFPALTLLALALSVNLFGDWLRDTLNPRLR